MAIPETLLLETARGAYERGRILAGLRIASLAVPMAAASLLVCGRPSVTLPAVSLLVLVITALVWRGGDAGRGARLGLLAGIPPLLLPMFAVAAGHVCNASFCVYFPAVCLAGGVLGGALVTWLCRGRRASPLAAAGVAVLAGSLGCLVAGLAGVAVLTAGFLAAASPALAARRA
jgi:hypothetical protein